jgi:hypothetical protein
MRRSIAGRVYRLTGDRTGTIAGVEANNSAETRRLSAGVRIFLVLVGLGLLFGAVLAVELATGSRTAKEGAELLIAPRPMIPATVAGFPVSSDPDAARFLGDAYRRGNVPVNLVEAAQVGAGSARGRLSAARVDPSANPASKSFRGDILIGAAAGYGADAAQFSYRVRDDVAVYTLVTTDGRLWVWFFRDAFVQLFAPASIGDRADAMFEAILLAMVSATQSST